MRIWLSRLGTAALALSLAAVVWVVAVREDYPIERFGQPIAVSRSGLPENVTVFGDTLSEVRISVRAPKSRWPDLQATDFNAWVDLTNLQPGEYDVPVRVSPPDPQVQVTDVNPPVIRVRLEERKEKRVPVRANIMDAPAFGYNWQSAVITPTTVLVSGSQPWVDQVSSVGVDVYLRGARAPVERTLRVTPRNADGESIERFVNVTPRDVTVTVPVVQLPGYRELVVLVEPVGTPAEGYTVSGVSADPKLVTVQGDPKVIAELTGYITVPVDISGADANIVEQTPLKLPESISSLGTQSAEVTVTIVPINGVQTVRRTPIVQGLGPGLTYTLSLDSANIFLSGPLPKLLALKEDSVPAILDLTALGPGVHVVEPLVPAPADIKVEGISPQTVEVTIIALPTPTPTPTPTGLPSPTPTATPTRRR